jgi:uncharacterized protein (DUF2062 family)
MFRRRTETTFVKRLSQSVSRKHGVRRLLDYIRHRALRIPGTPESVARGLATGVAVSFTPFLGLHTPLALGVAYVLRGNIIASALSSAIGNPFTFYFIFWIVYNAGVFLLGRGAEAESYTSFFTSMMHAPWTMLTEKFDYYWDGFILPIMVGFLPVAVVVWFLTYWFSLRVVKQYQFMRRKRIQAALKRKANAKEETLV